MPDKHDLKAAHQVRSVPESKEPADGGPAYVDTTRPGRDNAPIMAKPGGPPVIKLICGMISAQRDLFDEAAAEMSKSFSPVDIKSEVMDFDLTDYYDRQMGAPLYRQFVSFAGQADPASLARVKLRTNEIEAEFARRFEAVSRPINLDPGYVGSSKLVLASMKSFSHRVYLDLGVYAEVTLLYRSGRWEELEWTFPDYASGRYDAFLIAARDGLRSAAKNEE